MKKLLLSLLLIGFAVSSRADSWADQYAQYGNLIVVKLDSAPFPHPDRAQGHTYDKQFYPADKNYSDNTVGIFVPKGFRRSDKVNFVFYFYGWRHHVETAFGTYNLVPQFVNSGRNAILIVPQGPYDVPDSFEGKLEDKNGFKRFMTEVMATLKQRDVIGDEPVGDIILCGHSGGFEAISEILARGGMNENIREVFLFDALYGRTEKFMNWFDHYPNRRFVDIYTEDGGTKKETEKLIADVKARKPPVSFVSKNEADITPADLEKSQLIFIFTATEHDKTPYEHQSFSQYLKTSHLPAIVP
jgi:hypothetical protein